jgi:SAM-dependent methyltransferase
MSSCPLCGATRARETFRFPPRKVSDPTGRPTESLFGRAGRLVRCEGCGLVRQDAPPSAPYEDAADEEYLPEESGIRATARATIAAIETHRSPPGRLLDIGSGPGLLVDEARIRGWDATGVEPSAWATAQAQGRGINVVQGTIESSSIDEQSLDAVVLADVIEHLPDPSSSMKHVYDWTRPGGVVFVCTPDVGSVVARVLRRWWWSVLPGHLFYFSRTTLRRLMSEAGFDVLTVGTHPKTFRLSYYAGRFAGYSGGVARLVHGAVRATGRADRLVAPDFRDRIALIAQRR